jgi:hypothetical protein
MVASRGFGESPHRNGRMRSPLPSEVDAFHDIWIDDAGCAYSALEALDTSVADEMRHLGMEALRALRQAPPPETRAERDASGRLSAVPTGRSVLGAPVVMLRLGVTDGRLSDGPGYGPLGAPQAVCRPLGGIVDLALHDLASATDIEPLTC